MTITIEEIVPKIEQLHQDLTPLYNKFIETLDNEKDIDQKHEEFLQYLNETTILQANHKMRQFLRIIANTSISHFRTKHFYQKIERIIDSFQTQIKEKCSNEEIFNIFKINKRILLFLFQSKIIILDSHMAHKMINSPEFLAYFYPELEATMTKHQKEKAKLPESDNFEEKRQLAENDSLLCSFIRTDSFDDFFSYVEKNKVSMKSKISPSFFDTNSFLANKYPSLIQYAAFFGSYKIFTYLLHHNADLTSDLWFYSIHGRNDTIIHILEENEINPPKDSYKDCIIEAIRCHHNNIAYYLMEKYLHQKPTDTKYVFDKDMIKASLESFNFAIFAENFQFDSSRIDEILLTMSHTGYYSALEHLSKLPSIDLNTAYVSILLFSNGISIWLRLIKFFWFDLFRLNLYIDVISIVC